VKPEPIDRGWEISPARTPRLVCEPAGTAKGREALTKEGKHMAQAQAGASARRARSTRQKKTGARSKASSSKATKRSTNNTKRTASKQPKRQTTNKPSPVSLVESTAKDAGRTAKDAGKTVGRAASKAKVPLLAGGAALAGAAGGIALGAHHSRRGKGVGIHSDDLAKAARKVGDVGFQIGELALEGRRAREDSNGSVHRSPIEVVLQGLTTRRNNG
jgi:hypothetical protein